MAVCNPSRAAAADGLRPTVSGVYGNTTNDKWLNDGEKRQAIAAELSKLLNAGWKAVLPD